MYAELSSKINAFILDNLQYGLPSDVRIDRNNWTQLLKKLDQAQPVDVQRAQSGMSLDDNSQVRYFNIV